MKLDLKYRKNSTNYLRKKRVELKDGRLRDEDTSELRDRQNNNRQMHAVRKRKNQLSVFTYRPLKSQNTNQSRIDLQTKKTYKMSNYKPNPNIPEDRIITVWGCSNVLTLRAMDDQERKFAMHARLKNIFPQNTNFYIQEIREVFVSARDRDDYRTQKAFVELTTKERANEIMSRYWNPNNNASRSQIGISIRHYVKHDDEEEYLNGARMRSNKRPRSESSPANTDVQ